MRHANGSHRPRTREIRPAGQIRAARHRAPPPPNQIVYVTTKKGIALDSIYEAYWITGTMKMQLKTTQLGAAAYSLSADNVEIYKY
jgi:uncharacterized protein